MPSHRAASASTGTINAIKRVLATCWTSDVWPPSISAKIADHLIGRWSIRRRSGLLVTISARAWASQAAQAVRPPSRHTGFKPGLLSRRGPRNAPWSAPKRRARSRQQHHPRSPVVECSQPRPHWPQQQSRYHPTYVRRSRSRRHEPLQPIPFSGRRKVLELTFREALGWATATSGPNTCCTLLNSRTGMGRCIDPASTKRRGRPDHTLASLRGAAGATDAGATDAG